MFKRSFDKHSVVPALFYPMHPDIAANKARQWRRAFKDIPAGTYLNRPAYQPPHGHHLHDQPPFLTNSTSPATKSPKPSLK
eukprot:5446066-Pleurochrysis_carterae.AAC.1